MYNIINTNSNPCAQPTATTTMMMIIMRWARRCAEDHYSRWTRVHARILTVWAYRVLRQFAAAAAAIQQPFSRNPFMLTKLPHGEHGDRKHTHIPRATTLPSFFFFFFVQFTWCSWLLSYAFGSRFPSNISVRWVVPNKRTTIPLLY